MQELIVSLRCLLYARRDPDMRLEGDQRTNYHPIVGQV